MIHIFSFLHHFYLFWLLHGYSQIQQTERVRDENTADMSLLQAISIVLDRNPQLRFVIMHS